jgi:hypothetical protein
MFFRKPKPSPIVAPKPETTQSLASRVILWGDKHCYRFVLVNGALQAEDLYWQCAAPAGLPPLNELDWSGALDLRTNKGEAN